MQNQSFFKIVWQAGKKDFLLGLPWLPLYSLAELGLALCSAALLQLVFATNASIPLVEIVPGHLKSFVLNVPTIDKKDLIFFVPIAIVLSGFIKLISSFMSSYFTERAGHRVAHTFREKMLFGFLSSSGNRLDGKNPDYLSNQIMQDTALLQGAISKGTIGALRDCFVLVAIFIAMLVISYETMFLGLCIGLPLAYVIRKAMQKINYYTRQSQRQQLQISTRFLQVYQGLLTVNALRSQDRERADFQQLNSDNYKMMRRSLLIRTIFSPAMEFFAMILLTIAFVYKFATNFNAETYTALLILLGFSFRYLKNISNAVTQLSEIRIVITRIKSYLSDFSQGNAERKGKPLSPHSPFCLRAQNISFKTQDGRLLIEDCSLQIPRGKKVAFVGASGAGKTTFLRVIAGLITPSQGEIEIEPHFVLASQFPYLFKGTVRENIVYADTLLSPEHSEEKVKELLLALSLAYSATGAKLLAEKQLGFLGVGLSGGEKARLALARALYVDARLLLLDEPTANLDKASAQHFWQAVERWQAQDASRTVIAISHATEELQGFDLCYTFENGRIVAEKNRDVL